MKPLSWTVVDLGRILRIVLHSPVPGMGAAFILSLVLVLERYFFAAY